MDKQGGTYSQEELAVMAMFKTYKPSYRAQQMERAGLGEYSPENPTIKSLAQKGLIKVRGGKAMQLDREKATKILSESTAPDKYKRYIDNYSMTFKSKEATVAKVVDRFRQASGDEYLTVEEIADICPKCAFEMVTAGVEGTYRSDLNRMIEAAKWNKLPKGWTEESAKKFWESLTGDRKHKVTACIKKMKGSEIDDPGAFCASLADKMEPGWRSERQAKALSKVKKEMAPHMWVLSKDSAGGYLVTIGDPRSSSSKIKARFSGPDAKEELRQWIKYDMRASEDHVFDATGLRLIPEFYSQWYVDNMM